MSDVIHHSIKIVTDGKLCGKECPWWPSRVSLVGERWCRLFDHSVSDGERCVDCRNAVRRLKRMKP